MHESHTLERALLRLSSSEYPIEVFIDTEKIKLGQDFEKKMINELENSDVVLAIIGPNWLNMVAENNTKLRRIAAQDDPVRLELEKAIEREIPLVAVLLDDAKQPVKTDLPLSLANLATSRPFKLKTDFDEFQKGVYELSKFLQKFPNRRPNESLQKAQLSFFNNAPSWVQDTSAINVILNSKKTYEILANKSTYKFSLEQGTYVVQLQRGLIYHSNKLTVNLRPGSSETILYEWSTFGGIEIKLRK